VRVQEREVLKEEEAVGSAQEEISGEEDDATWILTVKKIKNWSELKLKREIMRGILVAIVQ
jgi:hypothetical protein